MNREAWQVIVCEVPKSQTQLKGLSTQDSETYQESLRTINTIHKNDWSLKQDMLTTRWCQDTEDGIFMNIAL